MWNHRIVRTEDDCFELAEVFYDSENMPYAYGQASIVGESMKDIIKQLKMFESSLAKEILNYPKDFTGDVNK